MAESEFGRESIWNVVGLQPPQNATRTNARPDAAWRFSEVILAFTMVPVA